PGIARIFAARGIIVTGADSKDLPVIQKLRAHGATVYVGYEAENIARATSDTGKPIDLIIASTVARPDNPERQAAESAGIPVYHRSQGLAAATAEPNVFTDTSTHDKTT